MALSAQERLRVFEILEIPVGPGAGDNVNSVTVHTVFGVALTLTECDDLRDEVDVYLDNLSSQQETEVQALVAEWESVRLTTVVSREGESGSEYDPSKARARIRELLQTYVPCMTAAQGIARRRGLDERQRPGMLFLR